MAHIHTQHHHSSPQLHYTSHLVRHHTAPLSSTAIPPSHSTIPIVPAPPPPAPFDAVFAAAVPSPVLDSPPIPHCSRFEPPITPPLSNTYSRSPSLRRGSSGEKEMPGHHYGNRPVVTVREHSHHGSPHIGMRTLGPPTYSGDSVTHVVTPSMASYGPAPLGRSGSYDAGYDTGRSRIHIVPSPRAAPIRVVRRHTDADMYLDDVQPRSYVIGSRPSDRPSRQKNPHLARRVIGIGENIDNLPTGKHTTLSERVSKFVNTLNPSIPDAPEEQGYVMQPETIPCDPDTLPSSKPRRRIPMSKEERNRMLDEEWIERGAYPSSEEIYMEGIPKGRRRRRGGRGEFDDELEECGRRMFYLRT